MSKLRSWALGAFSFLIAAALMVSGISGWGVADTVAAADETEPIVYEVAGWQICLEDSSRTSSLSAVSVSLGYSSVETTDLEQSAAEEYEYCLLKLSFVKVDSTESIVWENVFLTDGNGNQYSRMEDSFITDYGMSRLPGTDLNFGSYEGWICFEIPEDAEDLIFIYSFAEEELAIPVEIEEDEAEAESETGDNSESETENEDGMEAETGTDSEISTEAETEDALQTDTEAETESEIQTESETNPESTEDSKTNADTEGETDLETDSQTGEEDESETESQDTEKAGDETQTEIESETETESDTSAETEPETESGTSTETKAETETEKKSGSSESHNHSSTGSGKPSGSSSGSGSGSSKSHSSSHSGGESPSGSSSKSRKKSDSEDETEDESESELGSETESETDAKWVEIDYEDYLEEQSAIDDALIAEAESGYSFEKPFVVVNPYKNSPLTAMVIFTTEEERAVEVVVCGKNGENNITTTFDADTTHILPIYGLYAGDTTEVVLTLDDGTSTTLEITTEALDTSLADAEVTVCEDAAWDVLEEGELTFAFIQSAQEGASSVVAYDNAGDIRWYMDEEYVSSFPMKRLSNGRMMASTSDVISGYYYSTGLVEFDLCGKFYAIYLIPGGEHHDFVELENGNLLVCSCSEDFSSVEDRIVEIDRETGEVIYELNISDLIEPGDGASENATEDDWCHNNSIDYDEETDTILLSCRHLDAVLAINKTEKEIVWILGDPTGFTSVSEDLFLEPVDADGDFEWQYAQHNTTFLPDGDILLFDNGTHRTKVGSEEDATTGDDVYSRAVRYHIDAEAMTVEQVWSYGEDRGEEWYSSYISGADYLAEDAYWVTSGSNSYSTELETYDLTVAQTTQGILTTYIDLVIGDELVYELTIPASTYRSMRASLYTEENTYSVEEEAVWYGSLGSVAQADAVSITENETISEETVSFTLRGSVLYLEGSDHMYTQVIFNGTEHTYVYDITDIKSESDDVDSYRYEIPISLNEMETDSYTIQIMYDDELYNVEGSITVS